MVPALRIDWAALAQRPEVTTLAGVIARRWNLWVGITTPGGQVVPITLPADAARRGEARQLCTTFMGRADELGGCLRSLLHWSTNSQESSRAACHVGLEALLCPVEVAGARVAMAYASGFLNTESDETAIRVAARAEALHLDRAPIQARLPQVPRLTSADRENVGFLLAALVGELIRDVVPVSTSTTARDYSAIVGHSPEIIRLFSLLDRIADHESTILITGENGTGKELFARAIHANSRRREGPFITQNCSALNDNLLDSELFGHRRGAFTGAVADKQGLFELADRGTLFLDEVGDMSPLMQLKLLRVLQEGTFLPVGDTVVHRVNVRAIAATNHDLRQLVARGRFREDLYYRLNVIHFEVPPLRKRTNDVAILLDHYLRQVARRAGHPKKELDARAMAALCAYSWPGNVRELAHEIERLVVLAGSAPVVSAELLSRRIQEALSPHAQGHATVGDATLPEALEALERRMIRAALEATRWNKSRAAQRLGVSRRNLIRKVQEYELAPEPTPRQVADGRAGGEATARRTRMRTD